MVKCCDHKTFSLHWYWCKRCNPTHFKNNFDKWTSGNETFDKFIQDVQLSIKEISKGGFGSIYYAKWIDGNIVKWDIENQQWIRSGPSEVALRKFDNFANFNEDFLNELKGINFWNSMNSIGIYGITKDPETNKYVMVLKMSSGNLKDYLKNHFDNINWNDKLIYLRDLAFDYIRFHRLDILHGDFHPEVLCGEEYTKAADVYSFGIVTNELITGFASYYDVPLTHRPTFKELGLPKLKNDENFEKELEEMPGPISTLSVFASESIDSIRYFR
ncbi:hypothetical protein Glove_21g62 [Diversispora epigaea]|uniref:Protein kinase domain-containing protein n=1 Tax=Diversispora epigaea TaxID=1348612 RepID=A0A397JTX5_9GLOM|nr:hypothetical protein Glove_21g62 [Diversispora epigaea]